MSVSPLTQVVHASRSSRSRAGPQRSGVHLVQFYTHDGYLADVAHAFLAAAIERHEPLLIVATPAHRAMLSKRLSATHVGQRAARHVEWVDAHRALEALLVDDRPDPARFELFVSEHLDRLQQRTGTEQVCVFGEMVDVLWRHGNVAGALALERLSDELQAHYPFSLLCVYAMGQQPACDGQKLARAVWDAHTYAMLPEGLSLGPHPPAPDAQRLEEALEELQSQRHQLQVRDDFIAVAGHELATPISALTLQLRALMRPAAAQLPEGLCQRVDRANKTLQHLSHLATCLLDVTRVRQDALALDRRMVDLREVAAQGMALCGPAVEAAGCTCTLDCGTEPVEGPWDALRLRQVLQNLLSNAIKYGSQAAIEVVVRGREREAVLRVCDHGPGIAPADRARIFEPYERATQRQRGLGIGLWLAQEIVRAHGGRITVDSELGVGTCMEVCLPRSCPQVLGSACAQAGAKGVEERGPR